ncbi:Mad3/BUB1 homology region 1-domain-containing protein [Crucibulum laeve]|uniref:Mad3/BUB1 homology region 1-domain-containing protein n=1 Tax=Crucibulum laeve TaxID=68775 RepID=A0A5C3M633_9AGAR|nr:Mad3/BUB1 homology region 1-domain-containing protein [Crucibulum laeve]
MAPPPRISFADSEKCETERLEYRAQLAIALNEEDDPLAVYHQFVQWTVKNYGEDNPKSGLLELLEEATRQFKDDPLYKTDLRYLKLWSLYSRQVDRAGAISIFAYLMANSIGTSYAALYEDYAHLLEKDGRLQDADMVYRKGIKRNARPLERLKGRYKEFQSRSGSSISSSSTSASTAKSSKSRSASSSSISTSAPSTTSANLVSLNSTPASRYALMLAPPAPGKRPEKLRFHLPLLFTDEGVEYSIQEARARSMGLLGKKWAPPSASETSRFSSSASSSSSSAMVDFNDDGQKSTRMMGRRKSLMVGGGAEPTVTINTKEALADVFGMYNSPDKTTKLMVPGSKHAPLKKIEPVTPIVPPRVTFSRENENALQNAKTPTTFRPFVDENAQSARNTPFTPFIDPEAHKTPFTTPRPVLSVKDAVTPGSNLRPNENAVNGLKPKAIAEEKNESVFSKVFTPAQMKSVPLAPLRDVFTDDHGKPIPKPKSTPSHERAKSHHDVLAARSEENSRPAPAFMPFVDENAKTPFKVFSRPPEQNENAGFNAFTPKTPSAAFAPFQDSKPPAFTPFRDDAAFTPFVDNESDGDPGRVLVPKTSEPQRASKKPAPTWASTVVEIEPEGVEEEHEPEAESEGEEEQYQYEEDEVSPEQYETPLAPEHLPEVYEEGESYQEVPLGGRFGQFNVMTPITERTFEFTMSTRGGTPSQDRGSPRSDVFIPPHDELGAARAAEELEAELREEGNEEYEEDEQEEDQPLEPLRLSEDPAMVFLEEKTGSMSLGQSLTLSSKFRPSNPCNPFDSSILSNILSRIPSDAQFHDLRDQQSGLLDPLQRFAKKSRKTSGNSNNTGVLDSAAFPVSLNGHRFTVSEKLGEGGFGCVFKARDSGMLPEVDDDDDDYDIDDDEDEEGASMIALKVVKPRNLWEYHALRRLHTALPPALRRSVILPHALYAFQDESFLVLDLCPQGMLLNVVNNAVAAGVSQAGACLDELLVVFFTIELLRLIEAMHNAGFIHGDLKIDNCLLRLEDVPGGASAWSAMYQPSGEGGWSCKGLKVIDFGRTIDMKLFPSGQQFIAEWDTDDRDCFEVRENRPWTYQTDYFGLAGIIYCMLFGKYIQASAVVMTGTGAEMRHKIGTPFKRYWQTELWDRLFDILLNPCLVRPDGQLPVNDELGVLRTEMEAWLQANCNRTSNTLKGLLKKVEMSCYR